MIHYIKVRNFMSFKDEVCLDFEATDDTRFEDYHVVKMADGTRLLRFAVLYGANASGKSNLVKVIEFLGEFWRNVAGQNIGAIPFYFDDETSQLPSEFKAAFYVDNVRYEYYLKMRGNIAEYEELSHCMEAQPTWIIRREHVASHSKLTFNSKVTKLTKAAVEALSLNCLPNMSFFAARNRVNVFIPYVDSVNNWITNSLFPPISPEAELTNYWTGRVANDNSLQKYLIEFIQKADYNIVDIKSNIEYQSIPNDLLKSVIQNTKLTDIEKTQLMERQVSKIPIVKTEFEHIVTSSKGKSRHKLPIYLQSSGTLRTLGLGTAVHDLVRSSAFTAIDEIETSLHPELVEFIIRQFLEEKSNRSQMLVTTHYANLLDTVDDLLRHDNIWFIEKQENGSSELYSLVEFDGFEDIDNLRGAYIHGRFGALPHIKY